MLVSYFELRIAFNDCAAEWCGPARPEFNVERPSKWPEHVVVEVRDSDGTDAKYNRLGFYRLDGCAPEDAEDLLDAIREKAVARRAESSRLAGD
jgi:hypothetical protein